MDDSYLRNLLEKTLNSYKILSNLRDKPDDLITIKQELGKIQGMVQVIVNKIEKSENYSDSFSEFSDAAKSFLKEYSFSREIDTVLESYPGDSYRIKNIRLVILEALEKSELITKAQSLLQAL